MNEPTRYSGSKFCLVNSIVCAYAYNYRVAPVARFEDVLRQAALVLRFCVSLVPSPVRQAKIFDAIVSFILVDVVNPHSIWNFSMMPYPNQTMQQCSFGSLLAANRDFSVWAGSRAVVSSDFTSTAPYPLAPALPKKLSVGPVIKQISQFFFGGKRNGWSHQLTPTSLA